MLQLRLFQYSLKDHYDVSWTFMLSSATLWTQVFLFILSQSPDSESHSSGLSSVLLPMVVKLHCSPLGLLEARLKITRDALLGTSVKELPQTYHPCERGAQTESDGKWAKPFISLCFLTVIEMCPAQHSSCIVFPQPWRTGHLKPWTRRSVSLFQPNYVDFRNLRCYLFTPALLFTDVGGLSVINYSAV